MMDVVPVGPEHRLLAQKTSQDGKADVQNRHEHRHSRSYHAQQRRGFLAPDDSKTAQSKSKQEASGIAQENRRRIEVVQQEAEQETCYRQSNSEQWHIVLK